MFFKIKIKERNLDFLFHQCVDSNIDENKLSAVKSVIKYRIERNVYAKLNSDMTIDYAIKIPAIVATSANGGSEPDLEWIISATTTSAANSTNSSNLPLSSRSRNFDFNDFTTDSQLSQSNVVLKRKTSASAAKRLPWEDQSSHENINSAVPKVTRIREVAPLKAFPLYTDENDFLSSSNYMKINLKQFLSFMKTFVKDYHHLKQLINRPPLIKKNF